MDTADSWAQRFGLVDIPLFEGDEAPFPESDHRVLLDGGVGSFALSQGADRIWEDQSSFGWSWSSNLPHHVTVTEREVAVVRWDKRMPDVFTRRSVESDLSAFYQHLVEDRVESTQRVVDHMLWIFRRVRSLVADAEVDDSFSTDAYLAFMQQAIAGERGAGALWGTRAAESGDVLRALSQSGLDSLFEDVERPDFIGLDHLRFVPSLAVRHAGSEVFQEAHFELLRAGPPDLFGYVEPASSATVTRGGAHFTPPALARSLAEQAISRLTKLSMRQSLTIADPACGSGAFLHEALRMLRRARFGGHVRLVGRDISGPAISMARFVLSHAIQDWSPAGGFDVDLQVADYLTDQIPPADLVLMNPPFVSWTNLPTDQRKRLQEDVLLGRLAGRGDLSMAFVTRALDALTPGGVWVRSFQVACLP